MGWNFFRSIFGRRAPEDGEVRRDMESREPSPVQVERMRLDDLSGVLEVERLSYQTPWSRRAFVSELTENAYAHYIVAKSRGRVVGYTGLWLILDEAHITNVAVHPDFRGCGIGRLLMQSAIDLIDEHHCPKITLEVRRTNLVAQHLYKSFGFQMAGVRKGYYTDNGEDAFIMVREAWSHGPEADDRGDV